jgi:hypothetical protein
MTGVKEERINILEEQAPQQGKVIDFEEIISKSIMLPVSKIAMTIQTQKIKEYLINNKGKMSMLIFPVL